MALNSTLNPSMLKILVIDDDPLTQLMLGHALQQQGYQVIAAPNGEVGIEKAREHHPALIICDWVMPGIDGLEVCRQVKADPVLAKAFFILLTSRTDIEDRVQGLDTGADDFLSKPIDVNELKARVRAGLRLYQSAQELQRLATDLQAQKQILEAELTEAADYVRSLLPAPLSGPVQIESCFLPSKQLGGDCFDYYWLDPDYLVIYLLDMSGHGLGSALPSVSVQHLLRSQSLPATNPYQPASILKALNETFQMEQQSGRYFTIWYGVYNQKKRQLAYASAGHPPGILLSQAAALASTAKQLSTANLPIGFFSDTEFSASVCEIRPSDTLYLFSDGVYEIQQPNGKLWSLDGLIDVLTGANGAGPYDLHQLVQHTHGLNQSDCFADDYSLLQIKFS